MPLSRNSLEILVLVVLVLAVLILAVLVLVVLILIILVLVVLGAVLAIFRIVCAVVVIVIVVHFSSSHPAALGGNPIWLSVTGVVWQNRTKNMPNFFSTLVLLFY